jgi:putative FmdB family regulatory protein
MSVMNYKCGECGKEFAKLLLSPVHVPKKCPVCGNEDVRELGRAFVEDGTALKRALCSSCDTCGDTACPTTPANTNALSKQ